MAGNDKPKRDEERQRAIEGAEPQGDGHDIELPDEEGSEDLSHELVESFIGDEEIPHGRTLSTQFWVGVLKVLFRLVQPKTDLRFFAITFWGARAVGLGIIGSWLYFGLSEESEWDTTKLAAGMAILIFGPLALRGLEFVYVNLMLRGTTPSRWRDFWTFRRMMTPRSIQTAFMIGFWVLVGSGVVNICRGFYQLIETPRVSQRDHAFLSAGDIREAMAAIANPTGSEKSLPQDLLEQISPAARKLIESNSQQSSSQIPIETNHEDQAATVVLQTPTTMTLKSLSQEVTDLLPEQVDALVRGLFLGNDDDIRTAPRPFFTLLKGFLMLLLGPLALRLTCESIILFFRMNETMTDISKQLDRFADMAEEDRKNQDKTRGASQGGNHENES